MAVWAALAAGLLLGAAAGSPRAARERPITCPAEVIVGYSKAPAAPEVANLGRRMGVRRAAVAHSASRARASCGSRRGVGVPHGGRPPAPTARGGLRGPRLRRPRRRLVHPRRPRPAARAPAGWERLQWNFLAQTGVDAPGAWANLTADHRPGGKGTVVAVLDTGVAYRNWHQFHRSPDFGAHPVRRPVRLRRPRRLTRSTARATARLSPASVAESTNNGVGLTGLAYGASIMPVRILDAQGNGDAVTIARGIRYAVAHHARRDQPEHRVRARHRLAPTSRGSSRRCATRIRTAWWWSRPRATTGDAQIAYPARASQVISVGATTIDRCLATYSNTGTRPRSRRARRRR